MRVGAWARLVFTYLKFVSVQVVSGYYTDNYYYYNEDYDEQEYPAITNHVPKDFDIGSDFEVFCRIF